jgi:DNA-3-methyladenine glycosylase II
MTRPDESLRPALEALAARDADIARHFAACGLPPVRRHRTGFGGLLRIIMAQQVSTASAAAITARLNAAVRPLTPSGFLALDDDQLRRIGLSGQKIRYGRALAEDVLARRVDLRRLHRMDDDEAIAHLTQAKGVGHWTAEIYLLFALRRPDVWPAGDLAVQVALQRLKNLEARPDTTAMRALGEAWRPHRSTAARFLWHFYRHTGIPD